MIILVLAAVLDLLHLVRIMPFKPPSFGFHPASLAPLEKTLLSIVDNTPLAGLHVCDEGSHSKTATQPYERLSDTVICA